MNLFVGIGRTTQNLELKHSQSGTAVCRFTIAINEKFSGKDETTFMNIVTFNKTAENCEKYLSKGSKVAVRGRIQNGSYIDKDGITRYTTDVIANEVEFLNSRNQSTEDEANNNSQAILNKIGNDIDIEDEELPF